MFLNNKLAHVIILILFSSTIIYSGTTGKIAGRVMDKTTGEPLPSVNIVIAGTNLGSATDVDGQFIILNIPPGSYTVKASMIGYADNLIENVIVRADLTTKVNFELTSSSIQLTEVIVNARKTLINKDETSKTAIISSESFSDLPVANFQDVVSLQAGFTTDGNGNIHARGGRTGEIAYLVDGIPVRDPLSGGFSGQLDKYAIQELQVLTGGFSAEYGQALSGVVNIITKEGSNKYAGRVEFISNQINKSPYHRADALAYDEWGIDQNGNFVERTDSKGRTLINSYPSAYKPQKIEDTPNLFPDINVLGQLSTVLSGPVPFIPALRFFLTGRFENRLSQLPWGYNKEREFNNKLTYRLGNIKFNLSNQRSYRGYKPYSHAWKYRPEGYEDRKDFSWRDNIRINHVLSPEIFYEASLSYNRRYYNRFTPGKEAIFSQDGVLLYSNYLRRTNNVPPFWTNADNGLFIKNFIKTIQLKFDVNSQIGNHNLVKAGIEARRHIIERERFEEPYLGGFHGYENYTKKPVEFAVYVQDKMEFDAFIINAGVRFDYSDVNDTRWASVNDPAGYIDSAKRWIPLGEVAAIAKTQISPRLGIAFPITDKTVFYSSYGHFFQIPNYTDMYSLRDPTLDRAIIGNPGIEPKKTVAFEFGVKQQLGNDYSVDISAYFKDITNLVGSTYHTVFPYEYTVFDNSNYGGVQGLEVTFTKRPSNYWQASLSYTYSIAKGNESDPREGYNDYRRANAILRPKRVFFLDFDRKHVFYGTFNFAFPSKFGPNISGAFPFENLTINLIVRAASGLPYTPQPPDESDQLIVEKNSGRQPSIENVDIRIARRFNLFTTRFTIFMLVNNVFDNHNVLNVWRQTGDPWDAGPTSNRTLDRQRNPSNIDIRRSIEVGARFDF